MRLSTAVFSLAAVVCAAALSACSGTTQSTPGLTPATASLIRAGGDAAAEHGQAVTPAKVNLNDLYVLNSNSTGTFMVDILSNNARYRELGSITDGIGQPAVSAFVDAQKNLYVANTVNDNITEYARGQWSAPSFTYSYNMRAPYGVAADSHGNVYEADITGTINEYYQGVNAGTVATCNVPSSSEDGPLDLAVDKSGDVFVTLLDAQTQTIDLWEYPGGLANCTPTVLGASGALPSPFGNLALDKNGNLLVANGTQVAVIDGPGYGSVSGTLGSGYCAAFGVSLNAANSVAYVADDCHSGGGVYVLNYPSGTPIARLGTADGVGPSTAAVAARNAVY